MQTGRKPMKRYQKKHQPQTQTKPRVIRIEDVRGDEIHRPALVNELLAGDDRLTPAPTVRDELAASRSRPLDAPMATRIGGLPDPFAQQVWDVIVADASETAEKWWGKWQFTLALAVWSAACFALGTLA